MGLKCTKWEKVIYLIVTTMLVMSTIAGMYGSIAKYFTHPKGVATYIDKIKPFRYPWVIVCPKDPNDDDNLPTRPEDLLKKALLLPSNVASAAVEEVSKWSESEIEQTEASFIKNLGDKERFWEDLGQKCSEIVSECRLGKEKVSCCDSSWPILTKLGICRVLDIDEHLKPGAKPLKSLDIILKQGAKIAVSDHNEFYLENSLKVRPSSAMEVRLESSQYIPLPAPYGSPGQHHHHDQQQHQKHQDQPGNLSQPYHSFEPFSRVGGYRNKLTEEVGRYIEKPEVCGCRFSHLYSLSDEERVKECTAVEKITCVNPVLEQFEAGNLAGKIQEFHRTGELCYKLTLMGFGQSGEPNVSEISIKFESPYMFVMREYPMIDCSMLLWVLGTIIAMHVSLFFIIWIIVQGIKACCACCRDRGKGLGGMHSIT